MFIDIKLSSKQVSVVLKGIIIFNMLLLIGTYIVNSPGVHLAEPLRLVLNQFDLATENIMAAWYSSALLFSSAVLSGICFLIDMKLYRKGNDSILNYGWLVFVLCFAVLSFDELGSIHEHIGDYMGFSQAGDAILGSGKDAGWTLFYVLVGIVGLFMLLFSLKRLRKARWSLFFLLLALVCYLSNPFQEHFEIQSMRSAPDPDKWNRPTFLLIIEEGTEIFGSLFFIISILLYAAHSTRQAGPPGSAIFFTNEYRGTHARWLGIVLLALTGAGIIIVSSIFTVVYAESQTGVPRNWAPSIMALIVSGYCLYQYANGTAYSQHQKRCLLIFSLFSACLSIYLGVDRLSYIFYSDRSRITFLVRVLVMIMTLISFSYLAKIYVSKQLRSASAAAMIILLISIFSRRLYAPEIALIAFSLLLCILIANNNRNAAITKEPAPLQQGT